MAFVKKTWKDRIVQYANRRLLTKSGGVVEQVTVTRDEGTISEAGDQFNASNMNDLEQRVKDGFDDLNAADLPITSGSATNTKDYIDSKVDVSDIASSLTLDTNYFTASTKQVYKSGNVVNICLRGSLTATNGTILGTIATYYPKASRIICDFHNNGAPTPITTGAVWLNGENGRMYYFGGSVSSLDVCITVTYICN